MPVFVTTIALFAAAFGFHLVLWRIRLPKRQLSALLMLFATVWCVWAISPLARPVPLLDRLHVALFYISITLAYVITYTAIEGDSPTLSLMRFLAQSGAAGLPSSEVTRFLAQRPFVRARLDALVRSGQVVERNGRYVLAGQGTMFFKVILAYRKLYGSIPQGG